MTLTAPAVRLALLSLTLAVRGVRAGPTRATTLDPSALEVRSAVLTATFLFAAAPRTGLAR